MSFFSALMTQMIYNLCDPISDVSPCGTDARDDLSPTSPFFRLKDLRNAARAAERNSESAGEPVGIPAEWRKVDELAVECLTSLTKDTEIACWLTEAWARTNGFRGLAEGYALLGELFRRFGDGLFPKEADDPYAALTAIGGLNGTGGEGTILQTLRMIPLVPGEPHGDACLWTHRLAQREPDGAVAATFTSILAETARDDLILRAKEALKAKEAFLSLTRDLDEKYGSEAPPSSQTVEVLDEIIGFYRQQLGDFDEAPSVSEDAHQTEDSSNETDESNSTSRTENAFGPLRSREEAFDHLLRIAAFFQRTEPHSPLSYALETLVRRGRMSLVDLLAELLPDPQTRDQFLVIAGIHPPNRES